MGEKNDEVVRAAEGAGNVRRSDSFAAKDAAAELAADIPRALRSPAAYVR